MRRHSAVHFAAVSSLLCFAGPAAADLVPSPIPECVGKPDGTFCKLNDGTAGQCTTHQDSRRPGKSWTSCAKDPHECDKLEIGASCHGYLGKPSHCREFSDAEKNKKWRTCQADEIAAEAPAPAGTAPAATPAAAAPAAPAPGPEALPVPKQEKGMFSCSTAGSREATGGSLAMFSLGLLLFAVSRRARRAI